MSIKEIMAAVGFNDPSHFVRDFTRRYGVSPRRLRARAMAAARSRDLSSSSIRQQTDESANSAPPPSIGIPAILEDGTHYASRLKEVV